MPAKDRAISAWKENGGFAKPFVQGYILGETRQTERACEIIRQMLSGYSNTELFIEKFKSKLEQ